MDSEWKDGTILRLVKAIQIFIGVLIREKGLHLKESLKMYLGVSLIESSGLRQIQSLHNTIENLKPALLNFRNIHNCGLDHGALLQLSSYIPIVWTMHDCWPFIDYAFKWKVNKDASPEYAVLDANNSNKLNRKLLYEKKRILYWSDHRIGFVTKPKRYFRNTFK